MDWIWQDLRYGFRGLRNQPGFTALAMLTLALGIGAATTIFSVIQNVLLDPFPYTDAERVVAIQIHDLSRSRPGGRTCFQTPEFLDYQEQEHVFEEVIGGTVEDMLYTTREGTEQFDGGLVTANLFRFLGVPALIGRHLDAGRRPAGRAAGLRDELQDVGQAVQPGPRDPRPELRPERRAHAPWSAIMPQRFTKLGADLWRPVAHGPRRPRASQRITGISRRRLKPGVTLAAGGGRCRGHRAAAGQGLSGELPEEVHGPGRELGGQPGRAVPHDALHAGGGGRAAAADRVRQRGEHAAGAGHGAGKGDGGPRRRWARAARGWSASC